MERKEAIEKLRNKFFNCDGDPEIEEALRAVVPELRKTPDERVWEYLYSFFKEKNSSNWSFPGELTLEDVLQWFTKYRPVRVGYEDEKMRQYIRGILAMERSTVNVSDDKHFHLYDAMNWLDQNTYPTTKMTAEDVRCIQELDTLVFNSKELPEDDAIRLREFLDRITHKTPRVEWTQNDEDKRNAIIRFLRDHAQPDLANWLEGFK